MEDMDDDLIVPLKRVLRKKKAKIIVSSDSDETIIIDDDDDEEDEENKEPSTSIKKKVVHRRKIFLLIKYILFFIDFFFLAEIPEDDLNISTQKAIKDQTERDKRIKIQQEREELARLERIRKQKEYNGDIIIEHKQKQLPVAFDLVLETDPNTNNIIIEVDLMLVQYMKEHQGKINFIPHEKKTKFILLNFISRRCSISLESSI